MTVAAPEATPVEVAADVVAPGPAGDPAAPQPCQLGTEPAAKSLLFRDGDAYSPTCLEHEGELRAELEAAGETICGEVDIRQGGDAPPPDAVTAAADAPVEVVDEDDGELKVRFPVLVLENAETDDGRFIEAGALSHRALPLTLLAQPESAHGGDDPGPAITSGRIDTLERVHGPDVMSSAGEPFPEGVYVWRGTGAVSKSAEYKGQNIAEMVARRYLRGVSVDLVGMDYEILGEEGFAEKDPDNPHRELITHKAIIGAATLVALPAFGDAYVEVDGVDEPAEVPELVASAVPSWRSFEVGDPVPALIAAGTWPAGIPDDAVDQLAEVIADDGGEQRDAVELASAIVEFIREQWASGDDDTPMPEGETAEGLADTSEIPDPAGGGPALDEAVATGRPDEPQPCWNLDDDQHPATSSLLFDDSQQYAPTCEADRDGAVAQIEAMGFTVDGEVPIESADTPIEDTAEEAV